jgi:hypothetical protein
MAGHEAGFKTEKCQYIAECLAWAVQFKCVEEKAKEFSKKDKKCPSSVLTCKRFLTIFLDGFRKATALSANSLTAVPCG